MVATTFLVAFLISSTPRARASSETASDPGLLVSRSGLQEAFVCEDNVRETDQVALLVHGTSVTAEENWAWNYVRALPMEGWAVCLITLPNRALDDIQVSSEFVVYAIRESARLAQKRIDVIGISQGGLETRWAVRWWPGLRTLIDDLVMIATPNHGAAFAEASCASGECIPALWQSRQASSFLRALNDTDETPGDISYTSIYSETDPIVQPAKTAELGGASNIAVQDSCPMRPVEHAQMAYDAVVYAYVMDALRHEGPADPSRVPRVACAQIVMPHADIVDAIQGHAQIYVTAVLVQSVYPKAQTEPALAAYTKPHQLGELPSSRPRDGASGPAFNHLATTETPRTVATRRPSAPSSPSLGDIPSMDGVSAGQMPRGRVGVAQDEQSGSGYIWMWVALGCVVCAALAGILSHQRRSVVS